MVVIRSVITATHTGEFLGIAPTGRKVSCDAADMYRVAGVLWAWYLHLRRGHGLPRFPGAHATGADGVAGA